MRSSISQSAIFPSACVFSSMRLSFCPPVCLSFFRLFTRLHPNQCIQAIGPGVGRSVSQSVSLKRLPIPSSLLLVPHGLTSTTLVCFDQNQCCWNRRKTSSMATPFVSGRKINTQDTMRTTMPVQIDRNTRHIHDCSHHSSSSIWEDTPEHDC
jgi:hypothetical protein